MTVKQLINELMNQPEDSNVIFENTCIFIDGAYEVTEVKSMEDGTILLESDYVKNYWAEEGEEDEEDDEGRMGKNV